MSVFREVLLFLDDIGVYDVVLPILLIFSMVYAILEKTQLFGKEKIGDKEYTRKNINAMVAFVSSFFVVASAQLVGAIQKIIADMAMLMVAFVLFMILVGIFHKDGALAFDKDNHSGWQTTFMVISFVAMVLIFFNALGWLMPAYQYLAFNWDSTFVATALLVLGMGLVMWLITRERKETSSS